MIKKLLSLLILVVFIFSTSSIALAADNPQDNIAKSKMKFQQMDKNIIETNKQISELNAQVNKLNSEIIKNNKDISKNTIAIQAEQTHLKQLIEEVNSKQEVANKRLRAMYVNGYSENFFNLLLSSENFSDFLSKYDSIKSIISFDKKIFEDLAEKKKTLNESINDLNTKNQQLQQLKDRNTETLKQLNTNKQKLEALIEEFNQEKSAASQEIKDNEEKLIAHSISVIDSQSSTIADMKSAVQTLNSFLSQISTDSVRKKAKDYIDLGNKKLADMIAKSTVPIENTNNASYDGTYKATYTMTATAYTGGTLTAIGLKPVRDSSNLSTIAVDPSVIPLGTKVYIPGYGLAICSDTGDAIKGNIIDLYMNSEDDCNNWGRRTVTLYIIAYPGEW